MSGDIRNVFISHIHEDDEGLGRLKSLLGKHGLTVRDSSITSDKPNNAKSPDYIKSEYLAPAITWAGVTLVYISPGTKQSEYVDWEIEYAQKIGKRIVGVYAHGASGTDVPEALEKYADAVVNWDGQRIIDAIEGRINNWCDTNGEPREPRSITRYGC